MRYIRTKDGIYKVMSVNGEHIVYDFDGDDSPRHTYLKYIVKRADTIEELCDEFVIVGKKKNKIKEITKVIYSKRQLINNIIYGAIWTDKGLIYVAKMNDKGELELL